MISALTANDDSRAFIRANIPNLILTYLICPIDICVQRDSRGLYRKAREGKIDSKTLIGLDNPYPAPDNPDIVIDTSKHTSEESVLILKKGLRKKGYVYL